MNQPELARPVRGPRTRRSARASESATVARVTVTWTPVTHDGAASVAPTELELIMGRANANRTWTCPEKFGSNWVEALCSTGCREVVLTARLDNDIPAKHLVLELAELLTFRLTETQPLIRVLFLPSLSAPYQARNHA